MKDDKRDELVIFLLRVWFLLNSGTHWPRVKSFVENKLNELLPEINEMFPSNEVKP